MHIERDNPILISTQAEYQEDDEDETYTVYCPPLVGTVGQEDNVPISYVIENPEPFSIGQSYEKAPAQQVKCRGCGGTDFHVAMGDWYTAIRCVTCRWEACAHEG